MPAPKTEKRLGRNLGFFPVFAIGTGTMIGAGIFVLPGIATANAGPAAAISFLVGGIISMATAISMAELATGMPKAGGSYYFISRSMGPYFGTIVGVGAWLALVFKGSFALVGLAEYFKALLPIPVLITAVAAGLALLWLNYRGAESVGKLQNVIVIGLFLILTAYMVRGSFMAEPQYLEPFVPFGARSIFATTGIIFVSYLGITQLAALSEEVKDPARNLPRAFIASVGAVTLLYIGVMLVTNAILPLEQLMVMTTPLVEVGTLLAGIPGQLAILIAGFFATVSTANAAIMSSSRFPFAMSRDNLIPRWFVNIHERFSTPYRSVLVTGGVMLILVLLFDVEALARLGSTFNVMIFVLVNLSVIILRSTSNDWYRPAFRDPLYPVTQFFGIVASLMLLPSVGSASLMFAVAVIVLSTVWYVTFGAREAKPDYDIFDILEKDVPSTSMDGSTRVLVPVADPDYEQDLLHLAACLGDEVVAMNVIEVPRQTSLQAARESYEASEVDQLGRLEEGYRASRAAHRDTKYRLLVVFDHSTPAAIMEQAEREEVDLIVAGWQRVKRLQTFAGSVANDLLAKASRSVAIMKGHFPEDLSRITVPYGGGSNARYALHMAKRLSMSTGAEIEVLRVIHPDLPREDKDEIAAETEDLVASTTDCRIYCTLKERYSVVDTVLATEGETDLILLGDSNERLKRAYLGRIPMQIARHSQQSVIIVRRFRPLSVGGLRAFLRSSTPTRSNMLTVSE